MSASCETRLTGNDEEASTNVVVPSRAAPKKLGLRLHLLRQDFEELDAAARRDPTGSAFMNLGLVEEDLGHWRLSVKGGKGSCWAVL